MPAYTPRHRAKHCAVFTALFLLLAHGYRFLSCGFTGDSLQISQVGEELYQISLGRFMQPIYWQIRGYIAAPLLIGLFTFAFLAAACFLISDLFALSRPMHIALLCAVLSTCETLFVSSAAYLPWLDVYALSLLLCTLGIWLLERVRFGFLAAPVCFCLALGLYQSYLPAASTLIILVLIADTLDGKPVADIWKRGLRACAALLVGLVLYKIAMEGALRLMHITASADYNGVGDVGVLPLSAVPALLMQTYLTPIRFLFDPAAVHIIPSHARLLPVGLNWAILALIAVQTCFLGRKRCFAQQLTLIFLFAVLPLSLNFIQFIAKGIVSGLTVYAYCFFYTLPVLLSARIEKKKITARLLFFSAFLQTLPAALLGCLIALNIIHANQASLLTETSYQASITAMSRILDQAERTQGYIPGETPVAFAGYLASSPLAMTRPGFEVISTEQGLRYGYAIAYESPTAWYLQMVLGEPIVLTEPRLSSAEIGAQLAIFPQTGCCRMIDGILYVRLF